MSRLYNILNKMTEWASAPVVTESQQVSITCNANTGTNATFNLSKSGHVPLGLVGWAISGDASGYAEARQARLVSNTQVQIYVWNTSTSAKTWTVTAYVLWRKVLGGGTA